MTRRHLLILVGLIVTGVAVSYLLRHTRPLGIYAGDSTVAAQILRDGRSPQTSSGTADLTIILFTDYRCPACRKADPAMVAAVARDGNIRTVYKDWPIFGERSERAAMVALAAEYQGIYAAVHHTLMRSRAFDQAGLREAVRASGGDWQRLQLDLNRYRPSIELELAENRREATSLGLEGTPGYLIGPYLVQGALSENEFLRAFAQARRAARNISPEHGMEGKKVALASL